MRRTLGTLALLLALAGCGDDGQADDEAEAPTGPEVSLVHATAAGGHVADEVTVLEDDAAVAAYAGQFRGDLSDKITQAAADLDVPDGNQLVAAVVAVGCDVPPGATVQGDEIVPEKVASPLKECFAPVTTVALASVPG